MEIMIDHSAALKIRLNGLHFSVQSKIFDFNYLFFSVLILESLEIIVYQFSGFLIKHNLRCDCASSPFLKVLLSVRIWSCLAPAEGTMRIHELAVEISSALTRSSFFFLALSMCGRLRASVRRNPRCPRTSFSHSCLVKRTAASDRFAVRRNLEHHAVPHTAAQLIGRCVYYCPTAALRRTSTAAPLRPKCRPRRNPWIKTADLATSCRHAPILWGFGPRI